MVAEAGAWADISFEWPHVLEHMFIPHRGVLVVQQYSTRLRVVKETQHNTL